jgi:phage tail sheath gpL-like
VSRREDDPPCTVCGWHCRRVWNFSNNDCDVTRGNAADRLAAAVTALPDVAVQRTGYGYGRIGITVGDKGETGKHITFVIDIARDGDVCIGDVYGMRWDTTDALAKLIAAVSSWHGGAS